MLNKSWFWFCWAVEQLHFVSSAAQCIDFFQEKYFNPHKRLTFDKMCCCCLRQGRNLRFHMFWVRVTLRIKMTKSVCVSFCKVFFGCVWFSAWLLWWVRWRSLRWRRWWTRCVRTWCRTKSSWETFPAWDWRRWSPSCRWLHQVRTDFSVNSKVWTTSFLCQLSF